MINKNDFNFSKEELELLFWIKYSSLEKTIKEYRVDKISSLIRSKESILKKETDTKALKNLWLNEWLLKKEDLLQIKNKPDINQLEIKFQQSKFSAEKLSAIITECLTFDPFYPLAEKDKRFESVKLDSKIFINNLSTVIPKKESKLLKGRKAYENSIKAISNDIGKSNNLLFRTSLNVEGFGINDDTNAMLAGGSIIGYINGDRSYKNNVRKLSIDEILISCAKLISFLYVYNEPKKETIRDFCKSSRLLQMDLEEDVDEHFLNQSKWKISKRDGNNLKRKPAILVSFRKNIRTIKG